MQNLKVHNRNVFCQFAIVLLFLKSMTNQTKNITEHTTTTMVINSKMKKNNGNDVRDDRSRTK